MQVHARVRVAAPADRVWAVLVDHEGMSDWSPGVMVTVERRPGDGDGVGVVREVRMAGLRIRELVTDVEPKRMLAYRCISGLPLRDYRGEVRLTPQGDTTILTWSLAASSRSRPLKMLLALYARVFAASARRAAQRVSPAPPVHRPEELPMPDTARSAAVDTASTPAPPRTLAEAFQRTATRAPDDVALSTPDGLVTVTWAEYAHRVRDLAAALHAHGVGRGDTVALMMVNRPDFYWTDAAAFHLGATPFSLYNTSSVEQIRFLFTSAQPRIAFCDALHAARVLAAIPGTTVQQVVCVDGAVDGTIPIADFIAERDQDFDFPAAWRAVEPSDVLTLIYTSGTTGEPKGVQLTHANMLAQIEGTRRQLNAGPGDRIISFLPSAHIADRWAAHYLQSVCGTTVYPLADRTKLLEALTAVRPTMFGAVPQVWQKIRAGVNAMVAAEQDETRRAGIAKAMEIGAARAAALDAGDVPEALEATYRAVDETVLHLFRAKLGLDQARVVMSGAAAIPTDVVSYFNALGIPLIDGWGMSELSCMAAFVPLDRPRLGSVGLPLPGNDIRLADDGEILVRGPIVMKGYLGRPDLTAEALDADGWLHTGDIGRVDDDGYLYIVDRKKELLVNSSGKNLSPSAIEGRLKATTPLIGQAVAIGDNRPYVTALVVLDPDVAAQFAVTLSLPVDPVVLSRHEAVLAAVEAAVDAANAVVAEVEQVRKFAVLPEFWEPGTEVLTHTMKLRRRPIAQRYAHVVDALYKLPRKQRILTVDQVGDRAAAPA